MKDFTLYPMQELIEMKQMLIDEIARREREDFQRRVEEICQKINELKKEYPFATWYICEECETCGSFNDIDVLQQDITPDLFHAN